MRHLLKLAVLVSIFALGGTTTFANDNNDNRIGRADPPVTTNPAADGVPCRGLYTAGVGWPNPSIANPHGATVGTSGYWHVFENDEEMCHGRPD